MNLCAYSVLSHLEYALNIYPNVGINLYGEDLLSGSYYWVTEVNFNKDRYRHLRIFFLYISALRSTSRTKL